MRKFVMVLCHKETKQIRREVVNAPSKDDLRRNYPATGWSASYTLVNVIGPEGRAPKGQYKAR